MRKLAIAVVTTLGLAGCANHDGSINPMATMVGAGVGALAIGTLGYVAGRNSAAPSHGYAPHHYYHAPRYHYRRGW